ncbi:hypothetical protein [Butyrivibrio sp. FCS014]|uniref:hypothetical protein n=1 Tax=Butyrivibrio sp. FCS014 TaxID=1408304 RepID=UPI0012DFB250|nr:hypothetical protein [Butyrivibrio sp. FCS014]
MSTIDSIPSIYTLLHRETATKGDGNESFLVYLPEGYFDEANADKRYPVAYVFHSVQQ